MGSGKAVGVTQDHKAIPYWIFPFRKSPSDEGSYYMAEAFEEIPDVVKPAAIKYVACVPVGIAYRRGFRLRDFLCEKRNAELASAIY